MRSAAMRVCSLAAMAARYTAATHRRRVPALGRRYIAAPITAIAMPAPSPLTKAAAFFVQQGATVPWAAPLAAAPPSASAAVPSGALQRGLLDLWHLYLQSLARRPLLTKAATSFVCVCVGDSIAQCIGGVPFSASRLLRIAAYSSSVGAATGHYWHRWLEAHVCPGNPTSDGAVLGKMALDQLVLTPIMTAVFFAALKLMEGRPDAIIPFLQEKYLRTLLAGYAIWVPWNYASFKWIPQDLRILAGNLVGIGWGAFVSVSCINSAAGGPSTGPSACPTVVSAMEAVPAACPAVMVAVEAASLGAQ